MEINAEIKKATEPIYQKINQEIAKYMDRRINSKNADTIHTVTDLRFALFVFLLLIGLIIERIRGK